jgi:hypothetical protein
MKIIRLFGPVRARGSGCPRRAERISIHRLSLNFFVGLVLLFASGTLVAGQQTSAAAAATPGSVKHVLGFENIKPNAKGDLSVQGDTLQFRTGNSKAEVSIASIQDVFTEQDFEETIGGPAGTLAKMAVPYGGGRILSLFREKIDVLTVEYRDANGGLHGVIFTLPQGQALPLKRQLVALRAHTCVPPERAAKPEEKK